MPIFEVPKKGGGLVGGNLNLLFWMIDHNPPPSPTPFPFSPAIYSQFIDQTLCNRCGCESGTYFVGPYWPSFNASSPRLGYRAFMIKVWSFRVESLESMVRWINHMLVDPHWLTAFGVILHVTASSANHMKCTSFKIYPFDHFESLNMDFCSTYCCTGNSSLARVVHTLTAYRQHNRCNILSHAWILWFIYWPSFDPSLDSMDLVDPFGSHFDILSTTLSLQWRESRMDFVARITKHES